MEETAKQLKRYVEGSIHGDYFGGLKTAESEWSASLPSRLIPWERYYADH